MRSNSFHQRRGYLILARFAISGVFLFSGISKLNSPNSSLEFIRQFGIEAPIDKVVACGAVTVEILLGVLCLFGFYLRIVFAASAVLLLMFSSAFVWAMGSGYTGECGCFGSAIPTTPDGYSIGRNVLLALISVFAQRSVPDGKDQSLNPPQSAGT